MTCAWVLLLCGANTAAVTRVREPNPAARRASPFVLRAQGADKAAAINAVFRVRLFIDAASRSWQSGEDFCSCSVRIGRCAPGLRPERPRTGVTRVSPPVIHPWSARHPQVAQGVHREIHRLVPLSPHRASRVVSPVQRAAVHGADGQRRSGGRTMGHDVVGQDPHTCDRITACLLQTLTRPPHQGWPGRLVLRPADRKKKHR